jgi:hypothetical protein
MTSLVANLPHAAVSVDSPPASPVLLVASGEEATDLGGEKGGVGGGALGRAADGNEGKAEAGVWGGRTGNSARSTHH